MINNLLDNPCLDKLNFGEENSIPCSIKFNKELEGILCRVTKSSLLVDLENTLDILVKHKNKIAQIQPRKTELLTNTEDIYSIHHFKNPQLRILYFYYSEYNIPILLLAFCEKDKKTYANNIKTATKRKNEILNSF